MNCALPHEYSMVVDEVKHSFINDINNQWKASTGNNNAKIFITSVNSSLQNYLLDCKKQDCKSLVEIVTGHCKLNSHLFKIGLHPTGLCLCSMQRWETVSHFLCECPVYAEARRDAFERNLLDPAQLQCITIQSLLKFIRASGRLVNRC